MLENENTNYEDIRSGIFKEHNKIRSDPTSYIPLLEEQINYFRENILSKPGEIPIQTNEGRSAYLNAIEFLKVQDPVHTLTLNEHLTKAAEDHAKDIGPKGIVSHDSSDGKNVSDRIERYTEWDTACGENLDFGSKNPVDIIINLLVDDGVENRPHRAHLFNTKFNHIGVGIAEHKEFEIVVVLDYVGGVRILGTPHFDFKNFKYQYPDNLERKTNKPKTAFQLEDPDAPDTTISVKIQKGTKLFNGKLHKITKKLYTLEDGSVHIVEVEDI
jgi:uncharacterized protein YkwD